jgi:hypothetical protein
MLNIVFGINTGKGLFAIKKPLVIDQRLLKGYL